MNNEKAGKNIVISAVNLVETGTLAVLTECLSYLSKELAGRYNVIALVNSKSRFKMDNIRFYEFPKSKKSWLNRLYYEYVYFKKISLSLRPFLWLSLHDMTPNVKSEIRAVYCHHPSPFYNPTFKELALDPLFGLFHFFYNHLYRINIKRNDFVIVQQDCMRKKFKEIFSLRNVVVAHPEIQSEARPCGAGEEAKDRFMFFYPALPRIFKNFEVICEAAKSLTGRQKGKFELCLTISGRENIYSRYIHKRYGNLDEIRFLGPQTREKVYEHYQTADCMIFPSKIETWGMPITEFKTFGKPIFLADLEYARETLGEYDKARFFDPDDPAELAGLLEDFMDGRIVFRKTQAKEMDHPFASGWKELFAILLGENRDRCSR